MAVLAPAIPYILGASAAIGAIAVVQQGKAAKAAGKVNAEIARQNAEFTRQQTALKVQQQDRENFLRLGAIRAAHGKSGGVFGEGSVLDVIGDTVAQGELQKRFIQAGGDITASGFDATGQRDLAAGDNAAKAANLQAGTELLGGTSSVAFAVKRG